MTWDSADAIETAQAGRIAALEAENAELRRDIERHRAAADAARELVSEAAARVMNDAPHTAPMSPERRRQAETQAMLWQAMAALRPDLCHEDDRAEVDRLVDETQGGWSYAAYRAGVEADHAASRENAR